ncbi:hypothetical protein [Thermonema rossianum]|uniref:hypothetical protein n=1 Tax=Thermonema rossianum TaxID=55505 RepID=UPI0012F93CE1|nr:hypothetical protein [Thermonema rossianum]
MSERVSYRLYSVGIGTKLHIFEASGNSRRLRAPLAVHALFVWCAPDAAQKTAGRNTATHPLCFAT